MEAPDDGAAAIFTHSLCQDVSMIFEVEDDGCWAMGAKGVKEESRARGQLSLPTPGQRGQRGQAAGPGPLARSLLDPAEDGGLEEGRAWCCGCVPMMP